MLQQQQQQQREGEQQQQQGNGGEGSGGVDSATCDSNAVDAVAVSLASLAQSMQSIICQVGELFLTSTSSSTTVANGRLGGEGGSSLLQALAWEDEVARNDLQFGMNHASTEPAPGGVGLGNGKPEAPEQDACGAANKALQARLSPLPPHAVEQACNQWVQQLAQDCATRCPTLLQACTSAADLVAVEGAVHAAMAAWPIPYGTATITTTSSTTANGSRAAGAKDNKPAVGSAAPGTAAAAQLGGGVASAQAAAGESWGAVCERVLGVPPMPLWRVVLQPAFAGRAKELLAECFRSVAAAVQEPLAQYLAEAKEARPEPAGEVSCKGWPMVSASSAPLPMLAGQGRIELHNGQQQQPHSNGNSSNNSKVPWSERLGSSKQEGRKGTAEEGDKDFRQSVHFIRRRFDDELLAALQAALLLLLGPRPSPTPSSSSPSALPPLAGPASSSLQTMGSAAAVSSRAAELEPFVHSQCMDLVAQLAGSCRSQVQSLGMPKGDDGTSGAATAEQLLVLGRLCSALAMESRYLQVVLSPADSWQQAVAQARHAAAGLQHPGRSTAAAMRSAAASAARGAAAGGKLQAAVGQLRAAAVAAYRLWAAWAGRCLAASLRSRVVADDALTSNTTPLSWQETVVPGAGAGAEGLDGGLDAGLLLGDSGPQDMRFMLPACPSFAVMALLHGACQEVRRAGDHAAAPEALQALEWEVAGAALVMYARLLRMDASLEDGPEGSEEEASSSGLMGISLANGATGLGIGGNSTSGSKAEAAAAARLAGALTEKGVLQLLMDVRFMRDVLAGGRPLGPPQQQHQQQQQHGTEGNAEASDSHIVAALMERRRQGSNLEQHLQDRLDPIDWATYEPHLWTNVQQFYQRTATLLGSLTQLQRAYPEGPSASGRSGTAAGGAALSSTAAAPSGRARDLNPMNVLPVAPRFHYLPISIPSIARGPTAGGTQALARMQTRALSGDGPTDSYSFADLGLPKRQRPSGGMGQRVGDMASVLASGGNVDPAAVAAGSSGSSSTAAAAAMGGWNARFQTGSFGTLGSMLGDKAAEMTALAQQRFEHLSEPSSFSGLLSSFAKTTFR
uniref:Conserved oligomeric Golgi complex subunit 1 n=1 Tax=Dunaliella tertiolecta TaxID=3047 RepID=A0A7S3QNJ0_DUNTE